MKGEGFATHAPPLPYIRAMRGCGGEESNPLSEPSNVEEKERRKEEREGPRPREREKEEEERERRRKKKEGAERRATSCSISGSM